MEWIRLSALLLLFPIAAQGITDSLAAIKFQELAIQQLHKEQFDSAAYYHQKSLNYYQSNDDLASWINSIKTIGKCYRDDLKLERQAQEIFYRATAEHLWRRPRLTSEWDALAWLYVNMAYTDHYSLEQYERASQFYENARKILVDRLEMEDMLVARYIYRALGNIYSRLGDYKTAEVLLQQFLKISLNYKNYPSAAEAYSDLGILYHNMEKFDAAIKSYEAGLQLPQLNHISKGLLLGNLAETHNATQKYEQALQYAEKAQQSFRLAISENDFTFAYTWLANTLKMAGKVYTNLKQFPAAESKFIEAQENFLAYLHHDKTVDFADLYSSWGNLYHQWGQTNQALVYYQRALESIIDNFESRDYRQNPEQSALYAEQEIMSVLAGKAATLKTKFFEAGRIQDLELALSCHELIFEVEKHLRRSYRYESSKLFNIKESRARSERAIELALILWEHTQQKKYQEKAFEFAERSKSILLIEAYRKANADSIAGIPDHMQLKERDLQQEIALAEKKLFNLRAANSKDSIILAQEQALFKLRQSYTEWIHQLEQDYRSYYDLKYNFNTATVQEIQQKFLANDKGLLEFFVGESNIYAFLVKENAFECVQIPKDFPLENWVIRLKKNIEDFQFSQSNRAQLCEDYTQLAYQLYQKLIMPLQELGLPENLQIIPSGVLGFLPFDALLTEAPQNHCNFQVYPYLLYQHNVSYGYSATLQIDLNKARAATKDFIGFAPLFKGMGGYQALAYNVSTLQSVQQMIGGSLFINGDATIANFLNQAEAYQIIHLATHAEANNNYGDFSFIVFSDENDQYDSLFVKDIYLLELQADMVVLSACEAGAGALHDGEGIISLARGFLYAGAQSIITTTWSINDQSNQTIMNGFYSQLQSGISKDKALSAAKLSHIKAGDRLSAHPAFWAAFVPIGNMEPVFPKNPFRYLWTGALALIVVFFVTRYWWSSK